MTLRALGFAFALALALALAFALATGVARAEGCCPVEGAVVEDVIGIVVVISMMRMSSIVKEL